MIDGYRYKDGKIIVSDYNSINGNIRQEIEREYQDNIEEILVAENMIEYFTEEKEKVNDTISEQHNSIFSKELAMVITAIPAIFLNSCFAGFLSAIIKLCLHLGGVLSMFSSDNIRNLALIICSSITIVLYITKVVIPTKRDIQNLKKELSISKFTLDKIVNEIIKQKALVKKLSDDKRKDKEESLAYDSEYKWNTDYIRLDYVDKIHEASSNLWDAVAEEEDKNDNRQKGQEWDDILYTEEEIHQYMEMSESPASFNPETIFGTNESVREDYELTESKEFLPKTRKKKKN